MATTTTTIVQCVLEMATVEYSLYLQSAFDGGDKDFSLIEKQAELLHLASEFTSNHVWQNEGFSLRHQSCSHLDSKYIAFKGRTNFGDNIEDEWFLVYTLFQMSEVNDQIILSVQDDDGQFLLIESADHLPTWLNPATAENRVFIKKGKLHIIPIPSKPSEIDVFPVENPPLQHAIDLMFGNYNTEASESIQVSIFEKFKRYSRNIEWNLHHAYCLIPKELALVLLEKPAVVNRILDELLSETMTRKPEQAKSCLELEEKNFVVSRVSFTKFSYAKLLSLKIPTPESWTMNYGKQPVSKKSSELGFKLTLGSTILFNKCSLPRNSDQITKTVHEKLLRYEEIMSKFDKPSLKKSVKPQAVAKKAKEYISYSVLDNNEFAAWQNNELSHLLNASIENISFPNEKLPEDDDSWLTLSENDVHELLQNRFSDVLDDKHESLESVVKMAKHFINASSDYEGIETEGDEIDFNPSVITEEINNILNNDVSDEDEESSNENIENFAEMGKSSSSSDNEIDELISQMEKELHVTTMQQSFERVSNEKEENILPDKQVTKDENTQLDIDTNLVKNFLLSISSQEDISGPASNLLSSMGYFISHGQSI